LRNIQPPYVDVVERRVSTVVLYAITEAREARWDRCGIFLTKTQLLRSLRVCPNLSQGLGRRLSLDGPSNT
jgi:hypothetical protein